MVELNYGEVKWNPERISDIETCINENNWDKIKSSSKADDCKTFEKNNSTNFFNVLYTEEMEMEICPAYNHITQSKKNKLVFYWCLIKKACIMLQ